MEQNRVEVAVSRWDTKQAGYLQKFGPEILQDREFNLLRLQVWKRIVKQHKKMNLSEGEYDDLQFVKGQIRQMDDVLFPGVRGFFQKLEYRMDRAVDRMLNGNPAFLSDAAMLQVASQQPSQTGALTAVYVSDKLESNTRPSLKQGDAVTTAPSVTVAEPTPKPVTTPENIPHVTEVAQHVLNNNTTDTPERKAFQRDREIKTTTGMMRTIR